MSELKLYLLGPARIERNGQVVEVETRKAIALLAYLALHPERLSRDQLATLFWPEYDQERAYANLRRTLWALNKALGEGWLTVDNLSLELRQQAGVWVDVLEFQQLLAQCRTHGHRTDEVCAACLEPLGQAVTLVRGDFLAGFSLRDSAAFDDWHFFEAESLRKALATSLEKLVQGHSAQQEDDTAIGYARRWLALDPLHELPHRWLMQLYAWTGQSSAALRQFQECERLLNAELGAPPEPETTALYAQIRAGKLRRRAAKVTRDKVTRWQGDTVTDLPDTDVTLSPRSAELTSKPHLDFGEPVAFQARAVTLAPPVEFPAETARTVFVARGQELAALDKFLKRALAGQGGVLFVTGEAGSGKSALLREFAQRACIHTADLLVASGYCNVQSGLGDPYLPFRQILRLLTGDLGAQWAHGLLQRSHAERLWTASPATVATLLEVGMDLLDTFIPATPLLNRMAATGALPAVALQRLEQAIQQQARTAAGPAPSQPDLLEQVANFLHTLARRQPLLLIIDDLHWADAASLTLLFQLGRQLTESRVLLVGAYRPEDVAVGRTVGGQWERHPLEAVVNEWQRSSGERAIHLDQAGGREFVNAWLDTQPNRLGVPFRTALHRHTQGQPLFTVELVRALQARGELRRDGEGYWVEGATLAWQALPARVEAVIEERIARLDEPTRQLLAVASVEGEEFTAEVLIRVQGTSARTVLQTLTRELEKRHRLVRRRAEVKVGAHLLTRYQFSHALFQHYLYHALSAGERRLLHGEIAAALAALYQGRTEEITAQLAHHYAEAGETAKAIEFLLLAGDQARTLYAHQEAIAAYQRALTFLKEQGDYERAARTLMKLGLTYHQAFDFQRAQQAYQDGFTLWQRASEQQARALSPAPHALRLVWCDPLTLDPAMTTESVSSEVIGQLFSGLVTLSPELDVVPNVARSWEVLDEGRRYIFHLRDDVSWSDGALVTAGDFVYAWQRALDPASRSPRATLLLDLKAAHAYHHGEELDADRIGVHALDDVTLTVELEQPVGHFLHLLTHPVTYAVPRHVVKRHGTAWTEVGKIVTNGPYHLTTWRRQQSMVFTRNPSYHGRFTGNVQQVELALHLDEKWSAAIAAYEADQLDILEDIIPPAELAHVRQRWAGEYVSGPIPETGCVAFDLKRPPFNDVRVRRALTLAIDRETLANVVMQGYVTPASGGLVPPGMPGHSPGISLPYDPDQARKLLTQAGYPRGHNFPKLEGLTLPKLATAVDYVQAQWRENLEIEITWEIPGYEKFFSRLEQAQPQLYVAGWNAEYPDPNDFWNIGLYQAGWRNETYARLVKQAQTLTDQLERLKLYAQADRCFVEEAPLVPLFYLRLHKLVKPWVKRYPTSGFKQHFWQDVIIEAH